MFGVPSANRGIPGVVSVNHCASARTHVSTSAAIAATTLEQRDIDVAPFFEHRLIGRYLDIPVGLRQARNVSRSLERGHRDAVVDPYRVELQPPRLGQDTAAQRNSQCL